MAATLHDVARIAGVSYRTVSNVVNDYPHVRATTRERVQAAIEELGYQPNFTARALRSGRKNMVCLAVPEIDSPYFGGLAAVLIDEANRRGLVVITEQTNGVREREMDVLSGQQRSITDGVILSPTGLRQEDLDIIENGSPVVLLDRTLWNGRIDQVTLRDVEAATAVTDYLISRGHRRIAVIGANPDDAVGTAGLRYAGYRASLARHGLELDDRLVVPAEPWRRRAGADAVSSLLRAGADFSAIFAFNDSLALGAIHELQIHGIHVPNDISVVGFDDVEDSEYSTPGLTTIDAGWRQVAELALQALLHRLDNPDAEARLMMSDFTLVERDSVRTLTGL